jgi:hypothetical protein
MRSLVRTACKELHKIHPLPKRGLHNEVRGARIVSRPEHHSVALPNPPETNPKDLKVQAGPDLQLKAIDVPVEVTATNRMDPSLPPLRLEDRDIAVKVCLQTSANIALNEETPPGLILLRASERQSSRCCKLPGLLKNKLNAEGRMMLHVDTDISVELGMVPASLLSAFWDSLPDSMTPEGQRMFDYFNRGKTAPTTALDCFNRLQKYLSWLLTIAD